PPKELNGTAVIYAADYKTSIAKDLENGTESVIDLPKSNVLAYKMAGGNGVIIRPSGTEPKIKAYITAIGESKEASQALAQQLIAEADKFMEV
ncbi:MAG: phospho-sugar mutase, partial [Eubacterium sp.]|nr:phospho-sugar mutase [Eubacterium sp.]